MKVFLALPVLVLLAPLPCFCATLGIANRTNEEIIDIFAQFPGREIFMRLDLLPGASDEVENPDNVATLRVDTGLQFWTFRDVNLANARRLIFCNEHSVCIISENGNGETVHISGKADWLVPQKGDGHVCNLERFHPAMPMKEVCAILPHEMPRDDNGAFLTGMVFGGMAWAARLVPAQNGPILANSPLEHLELRRPLAAPDLAKLTDALYRQGYAPWQAEFPDFEIDFGGKDDKERQKRILIQAMNRFLANHAATGHKNHTIGEKCLEASIIMVPGNMLEALENSDEPTSDVQIFTINLRPCTRTLLLDVAAYRGHETSDN